MAQFQRRGSNWRLAEVLKLELHLVDFVPLKGNSWILLPEAISKKKAVINMKNEDDECFKWCVTRALNPDDANNLYGWAMCNPLPVGNFEWMSDSELKNWKNHPSALEVDLEYPEDLHDLHNDYPLAPERLKIGGVEKLIPNLCNKSKYIIHHKTLKLYESLVLKIMRIHRGSQV